MTTIIKIRATVTEPASAVTEIETSQRATGGAIDRKTGAKTAIVVGDDPGAPNLEDTNHTTGDGETHARLQRRSRAETEGRGVRRTTQKTKTLRGVKGE